MEIPKNLPQFEGFTALFITSGEYEAAFYIASNGEINEKIVLKMPPRTEAKDKQAFTGKRSAMNLLSYTNKGRYIEDLKRKFPRVVHAKIHDILAEEKLEEIYLFAPKYVAKRILNGLDQNEQKKIRMQFYKEYTKYSPLNLLEVFQEEIEKIQKQIVTPSDKTLIE